MHLQPYLIDGVAKESRWVNVAELHNEKKKANLLFVYIGKNKKNLQSLAAFFRYQLAAETFDEAETVIAESITEDDKTPDAIFIDTSLQPAALDKFLLFLKDTSLLYKIPIIYNQCNLTLPKIKFLKTLAVIDDISDFSSDAIDFKNKVWFLKKVKEEQLEKDFSKTKHREKKSFLRNVSCAMKRSFDIAISLTALLIALPILLLIALAIKLESKGPIFYISKRAGRGYKIIDFYKFRSMAADADKKRDDLNHLNQYTGNETGPMFFKVNNDPRITKVGKLLRNTSLDEIPQLINVLKGDMSIVGNRPLPLYEAETLTTNKFVERFQAPAGITGLWQVKKRGNADMSIDERIDLDIAYARSNNFLSDMQIILNTPKAMFQKSDV